MITIKQMSNILGISTTTVSNVIHGKTSEVSKETVKKVEKLLKKYDYVPNINARNLATNNSKIIGVAMNFERDKYENFINDPFTSELLGAIEKGIRANGYFMMLYISDNISEILKYVSTWNVDGLVFLGIQDDDCKKIKEKYKKPMVFIDSYFHEGIKDFVNVGLEDIQGAYEMTKYLIECGHKKIGFFTDNCKGLDYQRLIGHKKALKEYGIHFHEEDVILLKPVGGKIDDSLEKIYKLSEKYTAFFCMSDYYAVNIMNYMTDKGKKIPDEFSIVGFDDNIYGQMARPALTTVHQDITKKGEVAIQYLVEMIQGKEPENKTVMLPIRLVIRNTVKNLNASE
jgi:LacI family transcriptional regulator